MLKNVRGHAFAVTLAVLGALAPVSALRAQDLGNGWGPSVLEIANLPEYCQRYFRTKELPPNCDGVHHLCAGKVLINRSMNSTIPKPERRRIIGHAKSEVDYIFGRNNPQCVMMEEAKATQRQVQMMQNLLK